MIEAELQFVQRAVIADDHAAERRMCRRLHLDAVCEHRAGKRRERLHLSHQGRELRPQILSGALHRHVGQRAQLARIVWLRGHALILPGRPRIDASPAAAI